MSDHFWVYVNEPNDKAFVHISDCSHCNDGKGRTTDKLPHNGQWHGAYAKDRAISVARSSNKKTIRWCGFCARRMGMDGTDL